MPHLEVVQACVQVFEELEASAAGAVHFHSVWRVSTASEDIMALQAMQSPALQIFARHLPHWKELEKNCCKGDILQCTVSSCVPSCYAQRLLRRQLWALSQGRTP